MNDKWKHKDTWSMRGEGCAVEVCHWNFYAENMQEYRVNHKWNIYLVVGKKHPLYKTLSEHTGSDFDVPIPFDMHGGVTYFDNNTKDGYVKVGCDYSHYMDDYYNEAATPEAVPDIFAEAEQMLAVITETKEAPK